MGGDSTNGGMVIDQIRRRSRRRSASEWKFERTFSEIAAEPPVCAIHTGDDGEHPHHTLTDTLVVRVCGDRHSALQIVRQLDASTKVMRGITFVVHFRIALFAAFAIASA